MCPETGHRRRTRRVNTDLDGLPSCGRVAAVTIRPGWVRVDPAPAMIRGVELTQGIQYFPPAGGARQRAISIPLIADKDLFVRVFVSGRETDWPGGQLPANLAMSVSATVLGRGPARLPGLRGGPERAVGRRPHEGRRLLQRVDPLTRLPRNGHHRRAVVPVEGGRRPRGDRSAGASRRLRRAAVCPRPRRPGRVGRHGWADGRSDRRRADAAPVPGPSRRARAPISVSVVPPATLCGRHHVPHGVRDEPRRRKGTAQQARPGDDGRPGDDRRDRRGLAREGRSERSRTRRGRRGRISGSGSGHRGSRSSGTCSGGCTRPAARAPRIRGCPTIGRPLRDRSGRSASAPWRPPRESRRSGPM